MRCPFCHHPDDKVIDSRSSATNDVIRRRRECEACARRFTTYERVEDVMPTVVKKDGRRESFDRGKISRGLRIACIKRPVSVDRLEEVVDTVQRQVQETDAREIRSEALGDMVMHALKELDEVAYVRFSSVYRSFRDIDEFLSELGKLAKAKNA